MHMVVWLSKEVSFLSCLIYSSSSDVDELWCLVSLGTTYMIILFIMDYGVHDVMRYEYGVGRQFV
jgi:hypothetical protein